MKMALTATPPSQGNWGRWPHQQHHHHGNSEYVMMDPALLPYDSRRAPATSTPIQTPVLAPAQYVNYNIPTTAPSPHYQTYSPVFNNNGSSSFNGSPPMVQAPYTPPPSSAAPGGHPTGPPAGLPLPPPAASATSAPRQHQRQHQHQHQHQHHHQHPHQQHHQHQHQQQHHQHQPQPHHQQQPPYERLSLHIVTPDAGNRDPISAHSARDVRPSYPISQSPSVKSEPAGLKVNPSLTAKTIVSNIAIGKDNQIDFNTDVDSLLKALQSKKETDTIVKKAEDEIIQTPALPQGQQPLPPLPNLTPVGQKAPELPSLMGPAPPRSQPQTQAQAQTRSQEQESSEEQTDAPAKGSRKRYLCGIPGCIKSFSQKTHLEIHKRAHTGERPYTCKFNACGKTFTQSGNLKTHERRHTGEKPFACEICDKRFAQRGNVRAHRITHNNQKPFICKIDDCSKDFTQLGNLKAHQNKFHAQALKELTERFAALPEGQDISPKDRELWEYFATMYKNSNKGIKGRGKDRKVGPVVQSPQSTIPSQYPVQQAPAHHAPVHHQPHHPGLNHPTSLAAYSMSRPNPLSNYQPPGHRDGSQPYEMFDVETSSHAATSSTGTIYDEEHSRDLAFGDRMY